MKKFAVGLLAALICVAAAGPAHAQPDDPDPDFEIDGGDPDFDFDIDPGGGIEIAAAAGGQVRISLQGQPPLLVDGARLGAVLEAHGLPDPDTPTYAADLEEFWRALAP